MNIDKSDLSCDFYLYMGTFSGTWHPLWVEFDGSSRDSFTRGKETPFSQPQSLSFPCCTGTEGSAFHSQNNMLSPGDTTRPWVCHWPCMYTGRGRDMGSAPAPVLSSCSWHAGKSKSISLSLISSSVFLFHHPRNRLTRWMENDLSLVLGQVWCWRWIL